MDESKRKRQKGRKNKEIRKEVTKGKGKKVTGQGKVTEKRDKLRTHTHTKKKTNEGEEWSCRDEVQQK
jgi:hypothetical protein